VNGVLLHVAHLALKRAAGGHAPGPSAGARALARTQKPTTGGRRRRGSCTHARGERTFRVCSAAPPTAGAPEPAACAPSAGTSRTGVGNPVMCVCYGRIAATVLSAAVLLGGCTVGPNYKQPPVETPAAWSQVSRHIASANEEVRLTGWWHRFSDPILDELIERATASNHDLRIATARVRQARAERVVVAGGRWPQVNSQASAARLRASEHGTLSGLEQVPVSLGDIPLPGEQINLFKAGFDAAWEIDLFGHRRRAVEQADALLQAAEARRDDVLVSLIAEVAREYLELRVLQRRLDVARANVRIQNETAELIAQRRDAGLASDLEVAQARAQLERSRSRLPALRTAAERTMHRLSVLVGEPPQALVSKLAQSHPPPRAPANIALGLPSSLLERRADVRAAERELAAATAGIGVATAELFPRFSLSAALGMESQDIADLLRRGSTAWTLAPSMRWPVFDAGRARARVGIADARGEQALARFEQTVLRAFEDVENAVSGLVRSRQRSAALARAVAAARRAAELARERHRSGLVDFLSVLDAERTAHSVEDELAASRGAELTSCVALYKALGGGWEAPSERAYAGAK